MDALGWDDMKKEPTDAHDITSNVLHSLVRNAFHLDNPGFEIHIVLLSNALQEDLWFGSLVAKGNKLLIRWVAEWSRPSTSDSSSTRRPPQRAAATL